MSAPSTARKIVRRTAAVAALAAASVATLSSPAGAWELDAIYGDGRACAEGWRHVGTAAQLDAVGYTNGTVVIDGKLADTCTDGQVAHLYYRQENAFGTYGAWAAVSTGSTSFVSFSRSMVAMRFVTDVQIKVCRSGADAACGPSRYLHV